MEATYSLRNPLSLETDAEIENNINDFKPTQLMIIKQTQVNSLNGKINGGTIEISIIDGTDKKIAWKGLLDVFYGDFGNAYTGANASLTKFANKLIEDGLLPQKQ